MNLESLKGINWVEKPLLYAINNLPQRMAQSYRRPKTPLKPGNAEKEVKCWILEGGAGRYECNLSIKFLKQLSVGMPLVKEFLGKFLARKFYDCIGCEMFTENRLANNESLSRL